MSTLNILRVALVVAGTLLASLEMWQANRAGLLRGAAKSALTMLAAINLGFVVFLWVNHAAFPLNLDLMEGTVLQHFRRAAAFQPIYSAPSPDFVPLAYNPLYYVLAVPFGWIFGQSLFTLRLVAILGMLGSGLLIFFVVRAKTGSGWWGLIAAGLFAAAYRTMDTYLDNAHSDSWLLFTALLGTYLIDRARSRAWNFVGIAILVASFWFKQHGALFAVGGVLFLTWREGWRRAGPYWLVAALLGPICYLLLGPLLFGPYFHYFTWEVPRLWSELNLDTFRRFLVFIAKGYPLLASSGLALVAWTGLRDRRLSVWHWQFAFALLAGLMGALDPGSADNVFIPMGTWFILVGVLGLHALAARVPAASRYRLAWLGLFASFAILAYNPFTVIASSRARAVYTDLIGFLKGLDGSVYAPSLGQLPEGYVLYPAAHWVALDDMTRGPGRENRDHPLVRELLGPALRPDRPAYILANYPLEVYPLLAFLNDYYTLETDLGDRFEALRVLPKRFDHGWPRYLYRFNPQAPVASSFDSSPSVKWSGASAGFVRPEIIEFAFFSTLYNSPTVYYGRQQ